MQSTRHVWACHWEKECQFFDNSFSDNNKQRPSIRWNDSSNTDAHFKWAWIYVLSLFVLCVLASISPEKNMISGGGFIMILHWEIMFEWPRNNVAKVVMLKVTYSWAVMYGMHRSIHENIKRTFTPSSRSCQEHNLLKGKIIIISSLVWHLYYCLD